MLNDKAEYSNRMIQEKFLTTTIEKKSVEDARAYFTRVGIELSTHLAEINSKCIEQNCNDRLRILHDFYRPSDNSDFNFDITSSMKKGHDFKDYICPDGIEIKSDYIKIGNNKLIG